MIIVYLHALQHRLCLISKILLLIALANIVVYRDVQPWVKFCSVGSVNYILLVPPYSILAKPAACRAERGWPPSFCEHLLSHGDVVSLAVGRCWAPFVASLAGADTAAWATQLKTNLSGPLVVEDAARRGHAPALVVHVSASRPCYLLALFLF